MASQHTGLWVFTWIYHYQELWHYPSSKLNTTVCFVFKGPLPRWCFLLFITMQGRYSQCRQLEPISTEAHNKPNDMILYCLLWGLTFSKSMRIIFCMWNNENVIILSPIEYDNSYTQLYSYTYKNLRPCPKALVAESGNGNLMGLCIRKNWIGQMGLNRKQFRWFISGMLALDDRMSPSQMTW